MTPLLKGIRYLITYREPKDNENFELLEDDCEEDNKKEQNDASQKEYNHSKDTHVRVDGRREAKEKQAEYQELSKEDTIAKDLAVNIERMKKEFNVSKSMDVVIREFKVARKIDAFILYIEGMVDKDTINGFILKQLMTPEYFEDLKESCNINYIADNVLSINRVVKEKKYGKIIQMVLNGITALFVDGCDECLIIENQGYEKRNVEQPVTEKVIRGAQEGFSESLDTNITLIRRIIRNKNLVAEKMTVDKTNKTNCVLLYLENVANPAIIKELKRRIKNINIDFISGNGMLEELISDQSQLPFPQIMTTERPDRAASFIMDGKVILIIEGTPFASSIPSSFFESIQSPEDFGLKWQYATFLRYLRLTAVIITLLLPGLYVAVTLYHQEMIPTELLNSIVKSRENVPFPTIVEILFLELAFEVIREGGTRVPGAIGNTLGIVGALILGQAAAQAQLVSPILIIIVATAGINSFVIPAYSMDFTVRLLRFVFILFGAAAGFYGISVALVIVVGLACSAKSFGVPYFAPVAPKMKANPDVIASLPAYKQKIRPDFANPLDKYKAGKLTKDWKKGKEGGKK